MGGAIAIGAMAAVSGGSRDFLSIYLSDFLFNFQFDFAICVAAAMNPALSLPPTPMNLPSQPLATHCFQLSNMFSPNR